jgi:hypothetical protein
MGSPPDLVLACNVVAPNPQGALPDGLFQLVSVNQPEHLNT